jgi:hypothetical protein
MSAYFEALEAHNEASDPKAGKQIDVVTAERLRKFSQAHGVDV